MGAAPAPPQHGQGLLAGRVRGLDHVQHHVRGVRVLRERRLEVLLEARRGVRRRAGVHEGAAGREQDQLAEEAERLEARLVDDADDRGALVLRGLVEAAYDLVCRRAVEAACGLVREEQQGSRNQLHGDGDALPLATRYSTLLWSADACLDDGGQVEVLRDLLHGLPQVSGGGPRRQPQTGLETDVVFDGQLSMEDVVLWDEPRHVPEEAQVLRLLPADQQSTCDAAVRGLAAQHSQESGLAAARGAHDGDAAPRHDAEVDALQQLCTVWQGEAYILKAEQDTTTASQRCWSGIRCIQNSFAMSSTGGKSVTVGEGPDRQPARALVQDVSGQVHGCIDEVPGCGAVRQVARRGPAGLPDAQLHDPGRDAPAHRDRQDGTTHSEELRIGVCKDKYQASCRGQEEEAAKQNATPAVPSRHQPTNRQANQYATNEHGPGRIHSP
mmetsp:Transcript_72457/g.223916  ORF Transcript_72457/g.223916 Transcript_72457/m.223916 type:complete len:441 (-) Transcript_72457:459-1781(-)